MVPPIASAEELKKRGIIDPNAVQSAAINRVAQLPMDQQLQARGMTQTGAQTVQKTAATRTSASTPTTTNTAAPANAQGAEEWVSEPEKGRSVKGYRNASGTWVATTDETGANVTKAIPFTSETAKQQYDMKQKIEMAKKNGMDQNYINSLQASYDAIAPSDAAAEQKTFDTNLETKLNAQRSAAKGIIEAKKTAEHISGDVSANLGNVGTAGNQALMGEYGTKIREGLDSDVAYQKSLDDNATKLLNQYTNDQSTATLKAYNDAKAAADANKTSLLQKQADLETKAYTTAKDELGSIAGSDYFAGLSKEEQDKLISSYTSLPAVFRQSIADSALRKNMTDKQQAKLDTSTNAAKFAAASLGSVTAENAWSMAQDLAKDSFYTSDQINGWFSQALAIKNDKTLSPEEKDSKMADLKSSITGDVTKIASKDVEDFNFYKELVSSNPVLAAQFAKKMGYTDAETAAAAAGASGTINYVNPTTGITMQTVNGQLQITTPEGYDQTPSKFGGKLGKECGEYVANVSGLSLPNDAAGKEALAVKRAPKVGDIFIQHIGQYDHAGFVKTINADGTISTDEFNRGLDHKRSDTVIPASAIYGYIDNPKAVQPMTSAQAYTILAQRGQTIPTGIPADQKDAVAISLASAAPKDESNREYTDAQKMLMGTVDVGKITDVQKKTLEDAGLSVNDVTNYLASGKTFQPTPAQKEQATSMADGIQELLTMPGLYDAVGHNFFMQPYYTATGHFQPGTAAEDFRVKFENLRSTLILPNLDKMKGSLSDKDVEFLKTTAGALALTQSPEAFVKNWNDILSKLALAAYPDGTCPSGLAGSFPTNPITQAANDATAIFNGNLDESDLQDIRNIRATSTNKK